MSESSLRRMFSQIKQPFYNWASIESFPLLGRDFVEHQIATVNAISKYALPVTQGLRAFKAVHGVPEYFRRFLDEWVTHPFDGVEHALERTQSKIHDAQNYPQKWAQLKAIDQAVLRITVASDASPHSLDTRTQLGESLGLAKPVDNAAVQNSIRRLIVGQILVRIEHGSYRFEDTQFAQWIEDQ
jgi:transcription termination factor NusB